MPNVLVIDDEKDICELLEAKLAGPDLKVFSALDGKQGFEKVLTVTPDCVVLDIRMPHEDGLSFLRKLRSYRHEDLARQAKIRAIPVIVLTGAGGSMKSLFQMEGISAYFDKPFDAEMLKKKILQIIDSKGTFSPA